MVISHSSHCREEVFREGKSISLSDAEWNLGPLLLWSHSRAAALQGSLAHVRIVHLLCSSQNTLACLNGKLQGSSKQI